MSFVEAAQVGDNYAEIARQIVEARERLARELARIKLEPIATLAYLAEKAHWQAERGGWSAGLEAWIEYVETFTLHEPVKLAAQSLYDAKIERRRERLEERAEKKRAEAEARAASARKIADAIPLGQPILVGHHSEKRARRDAEKIRGGFAKAHELAKEADELARRAEKVGTGGVSSDDPGAVEKLRARIAELEAFAEEKKMLLAKFRAMAGKEATLLGRPCGQDEHIEISERLEYEHPGDASRWLGSAARAFPWAPKMSSSEASEIRRLEKRISEIEQGRQTPERASIEFRGGVLEDDPRANRVCFVFREKPSRATIELLRSRGFVFSRERGAWQRKRSEGAWQIAESLVELIGG